MKELANCTELHFRLKSKKEIALRYDRQKKPNQSRWFLKQYDSGYSTEDLQEILAKITELDELYNQ